MPAADIETRIDAHLEKEQAARDKEARDQLRMQLAERDRLALLEKEQAVANAARGRLHSRMSAGTAAPSTWLSRPSRMMVSAVPATSSFW